MARLPSSWTTADRRALHDEPLAVVQGAVPPDLHGHFFVVGPAGTVASGGLPFAESASTSVLVGDGRVVRVDFDPTGPKVSTRLVETACYFADVAAHQLSRWGDLRFEDLGLARINPTLGARNTLNTAFLVLPPRPGAWDAPRLLLTSDAGRPWELDPLTLRLKTPVGSGEHWRGDGENLRPFPPRFASAHPGWDAGAGVGYFVSFGKGLSDFASTVPVLARSVELRRQLRRSTEHLADSLGAAHAHRDVARSLRALARVGFEAQQRVPAGIRRRLPARFTRLVRWDGLGPPSVHELFTAWGTPVLLDESCHQIAVTDHWIVVLDTAFRIGARSLIDVPFARHPTVDRVLRDLASLRVGDRGRMWLVRRSDLGGVGGRVVARSLDLPLGACHFVADADDRGGRRVRLWVSHNSGTDVSQWVAPFDVELATGQRVAARARGLPPAPMDLSRFGVYDIDPESRTVIDCSVIAKSPQFWEMSLYAGPHVGTPTPGPRAWGDLFWNGLGFFPELATQAEYDLYDQYPGRLVPSSRLRHLAAHGGAPSSLFRLGLDRPFSDDTEVVVKDTWLAPEGVIVGSPQFVPRPDRPAGVTEDRWGYLVVVAWLPDDGGPTAPEFWVFDAERLHAGPRCKLRTPRLRLGFCAHTAWLDRLASPTSYQVDIAADLDPAAARCGPSVRRFFEQEVYPRFD